MNWQQMMDKELNSKKGKKVSSLLSAIMDYQKSNAASKKFYASNYAAWCKQLKKLDAELARYLQI